MKSPSRSRFCLSWLKTVWKEAQQGACHRTAAPISGRIATFDGRFAVIRQMRPYQSPTISLHFAMFLISARMPATPILKTRPRATDGSPSMQVFRIEVEAESGLLRNRPADFRFAHF
jgi:hypothetical protein